MYSYQLILKVINDKKNIIFKRHKRHSSKVAIEKLEDGLLKNILMVENFATSLMF
ncbi:MAG: hypothetical protein ACQER9_04755 [Nanobdellota archaeon]